MAHRILSPERSGPGARRGCRSAMAAALAAIGLASCASSVDYRIAGRVLDASTGAPVAGARVHEGAYAPDLAAGAVTGADGRFAYLSYPEEHNVVVEAPGYVDWRTTVGLGRTAGGVWLDAGLTPAAAPGASGSGQVPAAD